MGEHGENSIFHYSDINAVAAIISSSKLWLTNAFFLNDSREIMEGIDTISSALDEHILTLKDSPELVRGARFLQGGFMYARTAAESQGIYTCSFSKSGDLLSQWQAYGFFAIEFDERLLDVQPDLKTVALPVLSPCMYAEDKKLSIAKIAVQQYCAELNDILINENPEGGIEQIKELMVLAACFKNRHFEAEQEVRLIRHSVGPKIRFRAKDDHLVPYLEHEFAPSAIKAVHIGPVKNPVLAAESLRILLQSNGMSGVDIVKSQIPFRS
ncbi:hypothetical protein AL064_18990 [Pseudomonas syringae pv. syringae]|uniref:DUF2971 domain-containing protein n=1 Tax=Pseudomonas syringae TaxID=317 RepID=UPI0007607524|nr:DUF2971 domain-containing protein [Pseudomonas syringae]KWS07497.1 hypothetical protein AL064_18990 [Pseudomonas syringae pv. syringae]